MRFDCGESATEKRRRLSVWHKWFAWRPIRVKDHDCRWLEYIERRAEYLACGRMIMFDRWRYRDVGTKDIANISTYSEEL